MFKPFLALLCIPGVCAAQSASVEPTRPAGAPTVMTAQMMQARIKKLNLELQAIGSFLTVGPDGHLRCACGGGLAVPNVPRPGPGPGPGSGRLSPLDTQHRIQALQALQLVLDNERAGLETTIYSAQLPKAGRPSAVPQLTREKNFLRP